ncbi:MAG: DUF4238 domain-containing protein [bacterium]|nr:DUF4238 domain-containing protein [bacterium]
MNAKAQHFVPQFYLKNFAIKNSESFFINCFNKHDKKIFYTNIKNVANEIGYYNIVTDEESVITIEPILSNLESISKESLDKLISTESIAALADKDKNTIAIFVALQMLRTPENELIIEQVRQGAINRFPELEKNLKKLSKREKKTMLTQGIINSIQLYSNILFDKKWVLLQNFTKYNFWTSDNPVYRYNKPTSGFYGNLGLLSSGIQIIFPITSKLLLLILDPEVFKDIPDNYVINKENVKFFNCGQIIHSMKQIYSIDDNFRMAEKYLTEFPTYQNPLRSRIEVS